MSSVKEELKIDANFILKIKLREIAYRFIVSRSKVYLVIKEAKRLVIRTNADRLNPPKKLRK